jgi:hypothetical protein
MNMHDDSLDDTQGTMAEDVVKLPQQNCGHWWKP